MIGSTSKWVPVLCVLGMVGILGLAAAVDLAATGDPRCLVMRCVVVK